LPLSADGLKDALSRVGQRLDRDVELNVVGGAAIVLTGMGTDHRKILDCDVIEYAPPDAKPVVEDLAKEVGQELGLPSDWLNSKVQGCLEKLPDGWIERRRHVCDSGKLRVYALGLPDLLATKVIAGRDQDIADYCDMLDASKIRREEVAIVRDYLNSLSLHPKDQIDEAFAQLDHIESFLGD